MAGDRSSLTERGRQGREEPRSGVKKEWRIGWELDQLDSHPPKVLQSKDGGGEEEEAAEGWRGYEQQEQSPSTFIIFANQSTRVWDKGGGKRERAMVTLILATIALIEITGDLWYSPLPRLGSDGGNRG
ncbi:hypothetical protein CRG98_010421 [Punica granatum]|uniref:Uncharacterized protein n=1 Tax=Punica granatum TaxID=22663 RepID=A0A2I0KKZ1_PUNGR|nr:hypothetical protein CRG98_010421 [Punica granatum]